jgi:hypothetical protein
VGECVEKHLNLMVIEPGLSATSLADLQTSIKYCGTYFLFNGKKSWLNIASK